MTTGAMKGVLFEFHMADISPIKIDFRTETETHSCGPDTSFPVSQSPGAVSIVQHRVKNVAQPRAKSDIFLFCTVRVIIVSSNIQPFKQFSMSRAPSDAMITK